MNQPEYLALLQRLYWLIVASGVLSFLFIATLIYLGRPSDDIGDNA